MRGVPVSSKSLLGAVIGMVALGGAVFLGVDYTVNRAVSADAEHKAKDWSSYFIGNMPELDALIATGNPDARQLAVIATAERVGDVFRFKLFDKTGVMTVVSDEAAAKSESTREHSAKAAEVLRTGISNISVNDGTGKANRPPLYVEAYVPIEDAAGTVRGVVEVYIDQTQTAALFKSTFTALALGLALIAALTFGVPMLAFLLRSRQAHEAKSKVEYLAHHEPMTGLLNRAAFTERLDAALQNKKPDETIAVVFMDVDDFKSINDGHGHEAGDEFLKHVARCIMPLCRDGDIVARPGGDEFTLALKGRGEDEVLELLEQLMRAVGAPIQIRGKSISGRLSSGVYMIDEASTTLADAMHKADIALYQAKVDGRNTYRVFREDMEAAMRARRELEELIRDTVEAGAFELHYQPLLDAGSKTCVGFEALLRLPDGKSGFVPPVTFIPVLEQMGLITAIGKWVIEEATRTAAAWPAHLFVSVNLSVKQFQDEQLVGQVKHALVMSGLDPKQLELEVTESMLMENSASVGRQLAELRALGVSVAMDDFGTGYSSLGYLWQFGFDKLKIDRSFVAGLNGDDAQAREILETIILLGHRLDMRVTAEGIETDHQAEVLSSLACDQFQGFLYGRPAPATDLAAFLLERPRRDATPGRGKNMAAA